MGPIATHLDATGEGCAAFASEDCGDTTPDDWRAAIETSIGTVVELIGVKHLDSDGRDVDPAVGHGVTMVGFRVIAGPA